MKRSPTTILLFAIIVLLGLSLTSQAQWVGYFPAYNITFGTDTNGAQPVTEPFQAPFPETHPGTLIIDFPTDSTAVVGDAAGLTKALLLTSSTNDTGAIQVDHGFATAPKAERGITTFDFSILQTPTDPNQQVVPGAPNGQDFVFSSFGPAGRVYRFVSSHTSASGGDLLMRLPGGSGALTPIGTYITGAVTHVEIDSDFLSGAVSVYLNGTPALSGFPFANAQSSTNDQITELFYFQNGVNGELNRTAIDNITYTLVPEPSLIVLAAVGLLTLAVIFRVRRKV